MFMILRKEDHRSPLMLLLGHEILLCQLHVASVRVTRWYIFGPKKKKRHFTFVIVSYCNNPSPHLCSDPAE